MATRHPLIIDGLGMEEFCPPAGYSVSYEIVDGGQGGMMLDGSDTVDEMGIWAVIEVPCYPLTEAQLREWFDVLFYTPVHTVTYYDPGRGQRTIQARRIMPAVKYRGTGGTGNSYWTGTNIQLKEVQG